MSYIPSRGVAWVEIPVSDLAAGAKFYGKVTGMEMKTEMMGPQEVSIFVSEAGSVSANLYQGTPAPTGQGIGVHIPAMGKLEDTLARVIDAGGQVLSDPIPIPEGRFAYCTDPDGTKISLFEAA